MPTPRLSEAQSIKRAERSGEAGCFCKIPDEDDNDEEFMNNVSVSKYLNSVSKKMAESVARKVGKVLSLQGFPCPSCPKTEYLLLPLSECKDTSISPIKVVDSENLRFLLVMNFIKIGKCYNWKYNNFMVLFKNYNDILHLHLVELWVSILVFDSHILVKIRVLHRNFGLLKYYIQPHQSL